MSGNTGNGPEYVGDFPVGTPAATDTILFNSGWTGAGTGVQMLALVSSLQAIGSVWTAQLSQTTTGSDLAGAAPITSNLYVATTVPSGTGAVLNQPSTFRGVWGLVVNAGANTMTLYVPAGSTINGASSVLIPAGGSGLIIVNAEGQVFVR